MKIKQKSKQWAESRGSYQQPINTLGAKIMNKSSIEKARAEFHGNEFGKYYNPATPERILCLIIILLSVIMLVVTW